MGKRSKRDWWVNDPTTHRSTGSWSESSARSIARNVKGASASRRPKNTSSGWHRSSGGCLVMALALVLAPALLYGAATLMM